MFSEYSSKQVEIEKEKTEQMRLQLEIEKGDIVENGTK